MRKDFGRCGWKRSAGCYAPCPRFVERLIFFQRVGKHRFCAARIFPRQSQCFRIDVVCLAKAVANPGTDIPRPLQMFLRAIEIITPERRITEGVKRIRLAKAIADPDTAIPRRVQFGLRAIEIIAPKRQIAEALERIRLAKAVVNPDIDISRRLQTVFAPSRSTRRSARSPAACSASAATVFEISMARVRNTEASSGNAVCSKRLSSKASFRESWT
jgi:hypothetical protein